MENKDDPKYQNPKFQDPEADTKNEEVISDTQISRLAHTLRDKPEMHPDQKTEGLKPKTIEDLSVLSVFTGHKRLWRKNERNPVDQFHVQAKSWNRPQTQASESSSGMGLLILIMLILLGGGGFAYWKYARQSTTQQVPMTTTPEPSLDDLLKKKN